MPRKKSEESNILNGLSEDQKIALHFQHLDSVEELKTELATANSNYRNARKAAKADLGDDGLAEIDEAIRQSTPEGEAKAKARLDIMLRVARWHGAQLGAQMTLLDTLPPRDFHNEGRLAGLRGLSGKPPNELGQTDMQTWLEGYHYGQGVLAEGFGRKPGPEGDAEHKARVEAETRDAEGAASGKKKRGRPRKTERVPLPEKTTVTVEYTGDGQPVTVSGYVEPYSTSDTITADDPNAGLAAGEGDAANDDDRDFRPNYARPENQEHPDEPAIGTEPSTHTVAH